MCGICGQFNFRSGAPVDPAIVHAMADRIAHRGPDDEGYFTSRSLGLGFRRLSIIDLSGGHQPMSDREESVWVVFNGEIYNFEEVRQELQAHGHIFRTRSDTEVLIHGYKQWGKDVLQRLNGMFGLAIWDERERQLMVARDRMGIKLIYYRLTEDSVSFASEARPLFVEARETPAIDPVAVSLFLRYRYTPSPYTIFRGVKKLAAGTRLIVKENAAPVLERWWTYHPQPFDRMPSDAEAEDQLLDLYRRAVKRHLISDVPVGLLLSGGMDSALLLALMNQNGSGRNTYSVGYGSSFRDDELEDAAVTAKMLQAPNRSVQLGQETFQESLHNILNAVEEPIATSSVVPMYHVCKLAREDVKVALVGQGPDELFGGYKRHLGVRYGEYWRSLPASIRGPLGDMLARVPRREWLKRGISSLGVERRLERYLQVFSIITRAQTDRLFQPGLLQPGDSDRILDCWEDLEPLMDRTDELGGLQFLEIRSSLPDELLMYGDKLSMAHGLEGRVPYLDQEIVEYVERLDASFKVRRGTRKWLHRRVCRQFLPKEILRRKKRGFAVNVVDDWFRNSLASELERVLLDHTSLIYNYLDAGVVAETLSAHKSGQEDNHKILFSLVVLEEVLRNCQSWVATPMAAPVGAR